MSWLVRGRRRGVALVSALMVMVIIVILSGAFVAMTASDVRTSQSAGDSLVTLYLAEAGVEYAMWLNKHNLAIYPNASPSYDTGFETSNEDGAGNDQPGSVVTLTIPTETPAGGVASAGDKAQEHILLNDLALADAIDWFTRDKFCGTFQVYQTVTVDPGDADAYIVKITSVGRIRRIPDGWDWSSSGLGSDLLSGTDWPVQTQRTIHREFRIASSATGLSDVDPTDPSFNVDIADGQGTSWYEEFR